MEADNSSEPRQSEKKDGGFSEIMTIINHDLYWGIGRMGCHDIPVPSAPPVPNEGDDFTGRQRFMRAYYNEDGEWTVSIDPVTPPYETE